MIIFGFCFAGTLLEIINDMPGSQERTVKILKQDLKGQTPFLSLNKQHHSNEGIKITWRR